jgi:DNA-binding response OmpR family regulator
MSLCCAAIVGSATKYLKLGADDYLSKPFSIEDVQQVLRFAALSLTTG